MSKGIEWFNPASPRHWFRPGHDYRDIVAGVVIDGEARWLKAFARTNTITFSEAFLRAHKKLTKRANA